MNKVIASAALALALVGTLGAISNPKAAGEIRYDGGPGSSPACAWGAAFDPDPLRADEKAAYQCMKRGGGQCNGVIREKNDCIALARGASHCIFYTGEEASHSDAGNAALEACRAGGRRSCDLLVVICR